MSANDRTAAADLYFSLLNTECPAAERVVRACMESDSAAGRGRPHSALVRALARMLLAEMTGSAAGRWLITKAGSGAPVAHNTDGHPAPSISLSHSGAWVACAASYVGAVGVDVEVTREGRNHQGIAEYAFGIGEQAAASLGIDRFYAIWTLREALAKASGEGLRQVTDSVDRVPAGPFDASCVAYIDGADWWLMHNRPSPGLALAAALRFEGSPQREIAIARWSVVE